MIGLANATNPTLNAAAARIINTSAVTRVSFAALCLCSPRRRATRAEIDTFSAKKNARPSSLRLCRQADRGNCVRAKRAYHQRIHKTRKCNKNDSTIAGHAMLTAVWNVSLWYFPCNLFPKYPISFPLFRPNTNFYFTLF